MPSPYYDHGSCFLVNFSLHTFCSKSKDIHICFALDTSEFNLFQVVSQARKSPLCQILRSTALMQTISHTFQPLPLRYLFSHVKHNQHLRTNFSYKSLHNILLYIIYLPYSNHSVCPFVYLSVCLSVKKL